MHILDVGMETLMVKVKSTVFKMLITSIQMQQTTDGFKAIRMATALLTMRTKDHGMEIFQRPKTQILA